MGDGKLYKMPPETVLSISFLSSSAFSFSHERSERIGHSALQTSFRKIRGGRLFHYRTATDRRLFIHYRDGSTTPWKGSTRDWRQQGYR